MLRTIFKNLGRQIEKKLQILAGSSNSKRSFLKKVGVQSDSAFDKKYSVKFRIEMPNNLLKMNKNNLFKVNKNNLFKVNKNNDENVTRIQILVSKDIGSKRNNIFGEQMRNCSNKKEKLLIGDMKNDYHCSEVKSESIYGSICKMIYRFCYGKVPPNYKPPTLLEHCITVGRKFAYFWTIGSISVLSTMYTMKYLEEVENIRTKIDNEFYENLRQEEPIVIAKYIYLNLDNLRIKSCMIREAVESKRACEIIPILFRYKNLWEEDFIKTEGDSLFKTAMYNGNSEVAKLFLKHGYVIPDGFLYEFILRSIKFHDEGLTFWLINNYLKSSHTKNIFLVCEDDDQFNLRTTYYDLVKNALEFKKFGIARELLSTGWNIDTKVRGDRNLLDEFVYRNDEQSVKLLIEMGANVNKNGGNLLKWALEKNKHNIAKLLYQSLEKNEAKKCKEMLPKYASFFQKNAI